jgi:hypothetical protein
MAGFMRRAVVDIAVLGIKATSVTCLMTREQTVAGVQNADPDLQVRQRTPSSLNMSHKAVDFRQLTGCLGAHRNPIQRTTIPCQSSSVRVRSDKLDYTAGTVARQNRAQVELGQLHLRVGRSRPGAGAHGCQLPGNGDIFAIEVPQSCRSIGGISSALLTLATEKSGTGLQRQESFTKGGFLAGKLCDLGCRSTDVHGGPETNPAAIVMNHDLAPDLRSQSATLVQGLRVAAIKDTHR